MLDDGRPVDCASPWAILLEYEYGLNLLTTDALPIDTLGRERPTEYPAGGGFFSWHWGDVLGRPSRVWIVSRFRYTLVNRFHSSCVIAAVSTC